MTNSQKKKLNKKALNDKLLKENPKFHYQSDKEQKAQGYKYVDNTYDNYNRDDDFIEKLADEIKQNALRQINIDNQKIKNEIIKEDTAYKIDSEVK